LLSIVRLQRDSTTNHPITRLPDYQIQLVVAAVLAAVIASLAAGLRSDAFYSGDPGVKLVAVRNIIAHPAAPFEVALPSIGGETVPYVEPFFQIHGSHAHAITSPLFPILSAPLFLAFGLHGLYILPAAGFLLAVTGCGALAVALDARRRPLITMMTAAAGTPLLFYGLEFWEHAVAAGCAAFALALFARGRSFASGVLFGAAVLMRPEAAWLAIAAVLASVALPRRPRIAEFGLVAAGALVALGPLEIYGVVHAGSLVPLHVSSNVSDVAQGWLDSRLSLVSLWFVAGTDASFWRVAPVVVCALATLALSPPRDGRRFLWITAALNLLLIVATAPNDGGAQWGPRYLLLTYLPLTVLAADGIDMLPAKNAGAWVAIAAALTASIWIQRNGYRQLRGTKIAYGRVVDFVSAEASAGTTIVTDLWWLDQVASSVLDERTMLYASQASAGQAIVQRLSDRAEPEVTIIRSTTESSDLSSWSEGTCFKEERRDSISTRNLVAIRLVHTCGARRSASR
jgi:hypothetical protein